VSLRSSSNAPRPQFSQHSQAPPCGLCFLGKWLMSYDLKRNLSLRPTNRPSVGVKPRPSRTRTGFLESKQHDNLAAECAKVGLWMRAIFEVGVTYGWRHGELLGLRVSQVNLLAGTIRLEPGTTKNKEGRQVTMTQPVRTLLSQCIHCKTASAFVFTREDGTPVRDFRGAWATACEAAKVPGLLFHDLRRWCREGESNPHSPFGPADFKSAASANFAIPARDHSSLVTGYPSSCFSISTSPWRLS
jgi:integrase